MNVVFVVLSVVLSVMLAASAAADFTRYRMVADNMAKVGVPESWMTMIGIPKAAAAVGLLVGLGVAPIGIAAAVGVVLFFICAIAAHVRANAYDVSGGFPMAILFLVLAAVVLALGVATT